MPWDLSETVRAHLPQLGHDRRLLAALADVARERGERREPGERRRAVALLERDVHERPLVERERRVAEVFGLHLRQLRVHGAHELLVLGLAARLDAVTDHDL